jgi:hypothetical protein
MKQTKLNRKNHSIVLTILGASLVVALAPGAHGEGTPTSDPIVDALIEKGIITRSEASKIEAEIAARQTNAVHETPPVPASGIKVSDTVKNMQLFGDVRFRYEYRGADNVPGASPDTFSRERGRYAARVGLRGDLFDDFNYGIRLETANNPRSPWSTFGNNTTSGSVTPSDKNSSGIYLGQVYLGWHPEPWYEMTIGRMPMPLYTTPMVWDSDINPEGAFEKIKYSVGDMDVFADFGQFVYQNPASTSASVTGDTFVLAWQVGGQARLGHDMSFKLAPAFYTYAGNGNGNGLDQPFIGQGSGGANPGVPGAGHNPAFNQQGINDLLIVECPAEFDFKISNTPLGTLQARLFGDFAYNLQGNDRASMAYDASPASFPGLTGPVTGQNKAYQIGFGIGSDGPTYGPTQGLVYGSTSKKNTWEARCYWQHVEQYALDVNLLDSDFFEGRANLEGIYSAFAYSFTDAIIGTIRYGHANPIQSNLGTAGNNLDMPGLNPIKDYNLLQLDVTWRF